MPFYEYQCKSCGHELEAMQKVSDAPLRKCPDCGKSQLERLMSAPVFRLKGAGWYETDFKNDKDKKRNLAEHADADTSKESETKSETKTDAKPDAKPDEKSSAKVESEAPKKEAPVANAKKPVPKRKRVDVNRRRPKPAGRARKR